MDDRRPISSSKSAPSGPRQDRRVGTVLCGKYTLARVIGEGGMATVYLGVHRNGLEVAIKILHPELLREDGLAERFVREGYVANTINHPGTVRILDDDRAEDGAAFLVMELLSGETLQQRVQRHGGKLPAREVLPLGHALCDVLAAAHERGIVHRDIKPENLFLTHDGTLKVLDFGIARVRDGSGEGVTQTGRTLGTPAFMPPEQALGHTDDIDGRTDVWAVGATLFTLISGEYVHEGRSGPELVVATATRKARSLASVAKDTPAVIVEAIDHALEFAKDDRWPSMTALRDALELSFTEAFGAPIEAEPRVISTPAARDSGRNRPKTPSASGSDQATVAAVASGSGRVPSVRVTPITDGGRHSTLAAVAPTLAAPSSGQPPAAPVASGRGRLARMGLLAAACLGGGLLLSLEVQRLRAPAPAALLSASATASASPSGSASPVACVDHRACTAALGKPALCRKDRGTCAPLAAEGCRILAEPADLDNPNTLWFGAMFPTQGRAGEDFGKASVNAVDLARRDFMEMTNGLPATRAGGPSRPLGVVVCDDGVDPARAAAHLIDEVGVPAILGFARSKEVLDLTAGFFNPRGVLALASNTASMLSDIPTLPGAPRMVWRTTTSVTMDAPVFAAVLGDVIEPELRGSAHVLAPGAPMRVVLLRVNNPSGTSYSDQLISKLRYNGKSVAENGHDFQVIVTDDSLLVQREGDLTRMVAEIVAYRPHVILDLIDTDEVIPAIEDAWPESAPFRPFHLGGSAIDADVLRRVVEKRPDLKKRALSVSTPTDGAAIAKFVYRYNELYSPKVIAASATDAPYDAFYTLAYATAALGDAPITGPALSRAIDRLVPPGTPIEVGAGGIYQALTLLAKGENIDLEGITTTLDFNRATGDPTANFIVFCLRGGARGEPVQVGPSGLSFSARAGKLMGTRNCP